MTLCRSLAPFWGFSGALAVTANKRIPGKPSPRMEDLRP